MIFTAIWNVLQSKFEESPLIALCKYNITHIIFIFSKMQKFEFRHHISSGSPCLLPKTCCQGIKYYYQLLMFSIYLFHMLYDWIYFPFSSLWSYTAKRPAGLVNFYMNIYLFFRKNTNQHFGECQFKICAYMKIGTYQFASVCFSRCFESRIQTVSN